MFAVVAPNLTPARESGLDRLLLAWGRRCLRMCIPSSLVPSFMGCAGSRSGEDARSRRGCAHDHAGSMPLGARLIGLSSSEQVPGSRAKLRNLLPHGGQDPRQDVNSAPPMPVPPLVLAVRMRWLCSAVWLLGPTPQSVGGGATRCVSRLSAKILHAPLSRMSASTIRPQDCPHRDVADLAPYPQGKERFGGQLLR